MTSLHLPPLYKGPSSTYSHILRSWGLGLHHTVWGVRGGWYSVQPKTRGLLFSSCSWFWPEQLEEWRLFINMRWRRGQWVGEIRGLDPPSLRHKVSHCVGSWDSCAADGDHGLERTCDDEPCGEALKGRP